MTEAGRESGTAGKSGAVIADIRVLIVISEPDLIEYARNDLQSEGCFRVEMARTGEDALERLRISGFDAIVSGLRLPGMGGISLLKSIRCGGEKTPFIILARGSLPETVVEAFNQGTSAYIDTDTEGGLLPGNLCMAVLRAVEDHRSLLAIRKERDEFRDLVENAGSIIFRSDKEGNITFFNGFAQRFFGFSAGEILGRNVIGTIVPASDSGGRDLVAMIREIREHPERYRNNENENIKKNGERVWISWTNRPIYNERGEFVELLSVGNDITDRKRAETALFAANRKLNLLSSVTRHDVLNQLNVLAGYLGLVKDRISDVDTAALLSRSLDSAWTIRRLIAFTKDYQEIGVHSPRWHDVASTVAMAASSIDMGGISLEIDVGDLQVYADPLLEKVFYALLDNALRHGERVGGIRISCHAGGKDMAIVVEDNGVGIPQGEKERIFDRGTGRNTGYGLFISREILSITDLSLRETGTFGVGARFEIRVPEGAFRFGKG
jgi:PAS domain S-box-containing protein